MCNEQIKFKLFMNWRWNAALIILPPVIMLGSAQIWRRFQKNDNTLSEPQFLLRAKDENKDQTYFLYRMSDQATAKTIFPVGNYTKPEIKQLATNHGLDVANKKESMGVCFVGEVGMKDFLREYLDTSPG